MATKKDVIDFIKLSVQVIVTLSILFTSICILFCSEDETMKKFASGWIGAIFGYWLK